MGTKRPGKILVSCSEMRRYLAKEARQCRQKVAKLLNPNTSVDKNVTKSVLITTQIERAIALTDMCQSLGAITKNSKESLRGWINTWID